MERKVKLYMEKADAFLEEAAAARAHNMDRSLAHSIYYAAYHAASALLAQLGQEHRKHRQTLDAFRQYVVRAGILTAEHNRILSQAQTMRDETDYDLESIPNPKKLREMHDRVVRLVADIKDAIAKLPPPEKPPEQKTLF